jgi:hypothetical protein
VLFLLSVGDRILVLPIYGVGWYDTTQTSSTVALTLVALPGVGWYDTRALVSCASDLGCWGCLMG